MKKERIKRERIANKSQHNSYKIKQIHKKRKYPLVNVTRRLSRSEHIKSRNKRNKNLIITLLIISLIILVGLFAYQATGFSIADFFREIMYGALGTEDNPYVITNCTQLQAISDDLNANYILGNDIDCSETRGWDYSAGHCSDQSPANQIDCENSGFEWEIINSLYGFDPIENFNGTLDGKNFSIYALYIYAPGEDAGLFSTAIGGSIKNIRLIGVNITGLTVGAVIGYNFEADGDSCANLSNIYACGYLYNGEVVGGIVGRNNCPIKDSYTDMVIKDSYGDIGAIIGRNFGTFSNCSYYPGSYETTAGNKTLYCFGNSPGVSPMGCSALAQLPYVAWKEDCFGSFTISEDSDGDGISNSNDNCPYESNPDQFDSDSDGIGVACEQNTKIYELLKRPVSETQDYVLNSIRSPDNLDFIINASFKDLNNVSAYYLFNYIYSELDYSLNLLSYSIIPGKNIVSSTISLPNATSFFIGPAYSNINEIVNTFGKFCHALFIVKNDGTRSDISWGCTGSKTIPAIDLPCYLLENRSKCRISLSENLEGNYSTILESQSYNFYANDKNFTFEKEGYGKIKFFNASGEIILNEDIFFNSNYIFLNSSSVPNFNVSAEITLLNLPQNLANPKIFKDDSICTDCYNFTSLNAGNVTFNVSSWSEYHIGSSSEGICGDGLKDGDESGVDCGGICSPCSSPPPSGGPSGGSSGGSSGGTIPPRTNLTNTTLPAQEQSLISDIAGENQPNQNSSDTTDEQDSWWDNNIKEIMKIGIITVICLAIIAIGFFIIKLTIKKYNKTKEEREMGAFFSKEADNNNNNNTEEKQKSEKKEEREIKKETKQEPDTKDKEKQTVQEIGALLKQGEKYLSDRDKAKASENYKEIKDLFDSQLSNYSEKTEVFNNILDYYKKVSEL